VLDIRDFLTWLQIDAARWGRWCVWDGMRGLCMGVETLPISMGEGGNEGVHYFIT